MRTKVLPELEFDEWEVSYDITRSDAKSLLPSCIYNDVLFIIKSNQDIAFEDEWGLTTYGEDGYHVYEINVIGDAEKAFGVAYYTTDDAIVDRRLVWI